MVRDIWSSIAKQKGHADGQGRTWGRSGSESENTRGRLRSAVRAGCVGVARTLGSNGIAVRCAIELIHVGSNAIARSINPSTELIGVALTRVVTH